MLNIQWIKTSASINPEATEILVLGTVMSHLDYCNSVWQVFQMWTYSKCSISKILQQKWLSPNDVNMKDSNSRSILVKLHWLPIQRRIQYKILTLVHKCLASGVPKYLNNLLAEYPYAERRQGLRSQHQERRLVEPKTKHKTFMARSFSCLGPKLWNRLLNALKTIEDTQQFKNKLKTYLFKEEYNC